MEVSNFKAHFDIRHPSRAAIEIVEAMPIVASTIHSFGEARKNKRGDSLQGVYERTYVSFRLDTSAYTSISAFLEHMLKEPFVSAKIIKDIVNTGGQASIYISIFCKENSGFSLDHSLLAKLSAKMITLDLDIYPDVDESK